VNKALQRRGLYEQVRRGVSAPTGAALDHVVEASYHPGRVLDETLNVLQEQCGAALVEQVMFEVTKTSFTGVVGPLAKLFLTVAGNGPRTLLARFETLIGAAVRGYTSTWKETSASSGLLTVTSERVTPGSADHTWKGMVLYLMEFAGADGEVKILPRLDEGRTVVLEVSWPKP
jgi:hypothetical protein